MNSMLINKFILLVVFQLIWIPATLYMYYSSIMNGKIIISPINDILFGGLCPALSIGILVLILIKGEKIKEKKE